LSLLADRFREDEHFASRTFLDENEVPYVFWSRIGD
jgi:hypothetical protein